jgi:hypothetical protein
MRMALSIDSVTGISRHIVELHFPDVSVEGVLSGDGDANRVELMMSVKGDDRESNLLMLNVTRSDQTAFERELHSKLVTALSDQPTSTDRPRQSD